MADLPPFPDDLLTAQQRLHEARTAYADLCRTLSWSVEPLPGWPGTKHPHTDEITGGREPSPGYTPEQAAEEQLLRDLVRDLAQQVYAHPFWATLEGAAAVEARTQLKHHPRALPDAA
ncbi:hypothetical protein [Streptomyces filamentosus]|uniref:hypothetical protein n=1 Tax=Streptomyces filamentosus TaxID=67294 RepID=UPI0034104AF6